MATTVQGIKRLRPPLLHQPSRAPPGWNTEASLEHSRKLLPPGGHDDDFHRDKKQKMWTRQILPLRLLREPDEFPLRRRRRVAVELQPHPHVDAPTTPEKLLNLPNSAPAHKSSAILSREQLQDLVAMHVKPFVDPDAAGPSLDTGTQKAVLAPGVSFDTSYTPDVSGLLDNTGAEKGMLGHGSWEDISYTGDVGVLPYNTGVVKRGPADDLLMAACHIPSYDSDPEPEGLPDPNQPQSSPRAPTGPKWLLRLPNAVPAAPKLTRDEEHALVRRHVRGEELDPMSFAVNTGAMKLESDNLARYLDHWNGEMALVPSTTRTPRRKSIYDALDWSGALQRMVQDNLLLALPMEDPLEDQGDFDLQAEMNRCGAVPQWNQNPGAALSEALRGLYNRIARSGHPTSVPLQDVQWQPSSRPQDPTSHTIQLLQHLNLATASPEPRSDTYDGHLARTSSSAVEAYNRSLPMGGSRSHAETATPGASNNGPGRDEAGSGPVSRFQASLKALSEVDAMFDSLWQARLKASEETNRKQRERIKGLELENRFLSGMRGLEQQSRVGIPKK
ncbi:hypothetical protein BDV95DRAFT_594214 [Massariosphaeria phaeospora]|uniref:Uncharacterized protein n=1 Tax=Massariosphaeria phaeospora TaxID=100035 RepID=A0A7C8I6F9_9PLEO|nr:hypothetical protein BDV95DRAFT_594214 [Massariosphaeria phaeospora]